MNEQTAFEQARTEWQIAAKASWSEPTNAELRDRLVKADQVLRQAQKRANEAFARAGK